MCRLCDGLPATDLCGAGTCVTRRGTLSPKSVAASVQALVSRDREPITPFISKIRALAARGVSTVLVIGGCGDFFDMADTVIAADSFQYKARSTIRGLGI